MNLKYFCCWLSGCILLSPAFAADENCAYSQGNMIVGKVTLGCLRIKGSGDFTKSTVTGLITLDGPLSAEDTSFAGLDVKGSVTLINSVVNGPAKISGVLNATNTTFRNKVQVTSPLASLTNSTTQDIEIKSKNAVLTLFNVTINGNCTFLDGNGVINATNSNSHIKGQIIGGKIVRGRLG